MFEAFNMDKKVSTSNDGNLTTTSLAIAEGVGYEHRLIIQLIRDHIDDFNDFQRVTFKIQPCETAGGIEKHEIAILTKQQAVFLITLMPNNEITKAFKRKFLKAFFELRKQQQPKAPQSLSEALRLAADQEEKKEQMLSNLSTSTSFLRS